MEQRDYLLNQIETFARFLAKIVSDLSNFDIGGNVSEINESFEQTAQNILKTDFEKMLNFSETEIIDIFKNAGISNVDFIEDFADLLYDFTKKNIAKSKSDLYLSLCLKLYKAVDSYSKVFSQERFSKIINIQFIKTIEI